MLKKFLILITLLLPTLTFGQTSTSVKKLNGIRFADQFATIDAAAADCGALKCTVIIPSTYLGTDCPTLNPNVTFFDYRGNGSVNCIQNVTAYNFDDGNVNSMVKAQMQASSTHANGSIVSHWFQTYLYNGTAAAGSGVDGVSTEAVIGGTLTGTLAGVTGNESPAFIYSTSGAITQANGIQGYVTDLNTRTTTIETAVGVDGLGCVTSSAVKPTNCYGLYGHDQTIGGGYASTLNYSIGLEGKGLLKYSGNSGAAGFDVTDHLGAVHNFLYTDAADNAYLRAMPGATLNLVGAAGTNAASVDTSNNLNLTASLITPVVKSSVINPASAGFLRMAKTEAIVWRNDGNTGDIVMAKNPADAVTFTNGIQPSNGAAPTCDAAHRGVFWYVPGAAGVKDTVEVCGKDATDVYGWRAIY